MRRKVLCQLYHDDIVRALQQGAQERDGESYVYLCIS